MARTRTAAKKTTTTAAPEGYQHRPGQVPYEIDGRPVRRSEFVAHQAAQRKAEVHAKWEAARAEHADPTPAKRADSEPDTETTDAG